MRVRAKDGPATPAQALAYVTELGGRTRKHKYLRDLRRFLLPTLLVVIVQAVLYGFLTTRPGRDDWGNIGLTIVALSMVPMVSAALLAALRRNEAPIVTSVIVTFVLYCVGISLLSAFRVPVSYVAIATCVPIVTAVVAYANIRFQRSAVVRAALAPFPQADAVLRQIGAHVPVLTGPEDDLSNYDVLLIDPQAHHTEKWSGLLTQCYLAGIEIMPWTRYIELWHGRLDVSSFDISHLVYSPSQLLHAHAKRVIDLLIVILTIPVTVPVGALVALYIFVRDGGPVLFVQIRRGFGGRSFRMYKFRTMYSGTSGGATLAGDKRIIPGCGTLRRLRLDELPQLFNVLIGDMSFIGPRPESAELAKLYEEAIPEYPYRTLVLPGITGWAQVSSGYTSNIDEAKVKLSYDLYYIKHMSFDLDLLILARTFVTILFARGAR